MKFLLRFLVFMLILAGIAIVVGFLLPAHAVVKREILIKSEAIFLYTQISDLGNWKNWSPWQNKAEAIAIKSADSTQINSLEIKWKSATDHKAIGSFKVIGKFPYDSIHILMDFGADGESISRFLISKRSNYASLTWILESHLKNNPITKWFGLFSDRFIGPEMEKGLMNLKKFVENNKNNGIYPTEIVTLKNRNVISVTDTCHPGKYANHYDSLVGVLNAFVVKHKLIPKGIPASVFHHISPQQFIVEVLLPIDRKIITRNNIICYETDSSICLKTVHFGNYKSSSMAYKSLYYTVNKNNYEICGPAIEEYVSYEETEADTMNFQTIVYLPIKSKIQ